MNHSKHKQHKASKRAKTQPSAYSPFDDSIVLLTLSKIHKSLHEIAKSKFDSISTVIPQILKEMNAISIDCKHKDKLSLFVAHLNIFELIQLKKYPEAIQFFEDKKWNFTDKTHQILKLSFQLLHALTLKLLQKQEQSRSLIQKAIVRLDLSQLRAKPKTLQQKIIESAILCISITADHFSNFEAQSFDFRQIYTEAYKIASKYLTQYHRLTETLFSICRKFPQENDTIRKSKKKHFKAVKKRQSLNLNSNRHFLKDSTSERSYLNHTIQPKSFSTINDSSDFRCSIRKTENPKRLKTIDPRIDLREQKQLCLSKLYGTDLKEVKEKSLFDKKYFKRGKLSTSLKRSGYEPHEAIEMKELESISKIYLPKLQTKKKDGMGKKEKLNAIEALKLSSTLSKLKPSYFDRIRTQEYERVYQSEAKQTAVATDLKETKSSEKIDEESVQIDKGVVPSIFESLVIRKELKEKLLSPLQQPQHQTIDKNQQNCQLI